MNALPQSKRMNAGEFLEWAEAQDRGRFQLIAGELVAMAPERANHARAKYALVKALEAAIHHAGLPCEAFVDGLQIIVDDETVFEPDALVNWGEKVPRDSVTATNPVIVAEAISPSSERRDIAPSFWITFESLASSIISSYILHAGLCCITSAVRAKRLSRRS